jgi:hypothetical protein
MPTRDARRVNVRSPPPNRWPKSGFTREEHMRRAVR